ncbi:Non-specific serine/threonine protein kinase [Bertholletia excelsa]
MHLEIVDRVAKSGGGIDKEGDEVKWESGALPRDKDNTLIININGIDSDARDIQWFQENKKETVKQDALGLGPQVKCCWNRGTGKFCVFDLVWGKVRSHPWWPGQIIDPSDSSEKAKRYYRQGSFLIAYFGDHSFAWNEESRIKPFRLHFSQMEKQSNSEAFCHAVDCALEEVSRRVECGLACSCLPKEVYDKIKGQIIVNAGIREELTKRDGTDEFSSATTFMPGKFVQYMKALAQSPHVGTDRLGFVTARAQLLAFYRWKAFNQLPLEDVAQVPLGKRKLGKLGDFWMNKEISSDGVYPRKKERCMADLMSACSPNLSNGESKSERVTSFPSVKKPKTCDPEVDDSRKKNMKTSVLPVRKRKFSKYGERIRRIASQLAASTPKLKYGSQKTAWKNGNIKTPSWASSEKSQRIEDITMEYPPPDKMLLQLYVAARDPLRGYSSLISSVSFFCDMRNSFCLENTASQERKTGRSVESNVVRKLLFEPETSNEKGSQLDPTLNSIPEAAVMNCELEGKTASGMEGKIEEEYSPTALTLNFSNFESIPSKSNLNKIFSRYGPLMKSQTQLLKKSKRAKVVFKRRADAEIAFSSSGKFSIFGPCLISYSLNYEPSITHKTSTSATK